jgi:hypothetical protein
MLKFDPMLADSVVRRDITEKSRHARIDTASQLVAMRTHALALPAPASRRPQARRPVPRAQGPKHDTALSCLDSPRYRGSLALAR